MQGKKEYQEKLFASFQLSERIPKNNFYRRLQSAIDLRFLYPLTKGYYGESGQKSIDPVVFFKLCLVGYLENIISDRKLMEHCSMRLDILFFIGYDIDEELPWHSTINRTRQLFPEEVFGEVFTKVLAMCVDKGMVSGHTQAIDSAPVKANASIDSLELKIPEEELESHLRKVRHISAMDREKPHRKSKGDRSDKGQRSITVNKKELGAISSRTKKWSKDQDRRPGAGSKGSKYTSNKTHYSPTDPDARISVKPGKARKLNCLSQLTVDTAHSSGENYAFLEAKGLKSFIPPHGTYKGGPDGFMYHGAKDHYVCPQGKTIPFTKVFHDHRTKTKKKEYRASKKVCIGCPIREQCLGKSAQEKKFSVSYYREEYERNNKRINGPQGRYMKGKRQSTVEPVFGTLTQFMGLRKINTIGIQQANKVMHLSAIAYNLKEYLKFIEKRSKSGVRTQILQKTFERAFPKLVLTHLTHPILLVH